MAVKVEERESGGDGFRPDGGVVRRIARKSRQSSASTRRLYPGPDL